MHEVGNTTRTRMDCKNMTLEIIPQSESMTFRLRSYSLKKLKIKARDERISVNTLMNQIILDYVEWDMTAISAGWMVMSKIDVKSILDHLSEEEIEKSAKEVADYTSDIRLLMFDRDDFEGFLTLLRLRSKKSGFAYKESNINGDVRVIIQHDMGIKWSLRTKHILQNILYKMKKNPKITVTPNMVVLTVESE